MFLQPQGVSLNKPFKDDVRKLWTEWMLHGDKLFTKRCSMKPPTLESLAVG